MDAITQHLQQVTQVLTNLEDQINKVEAASTTNEVFTTNKGKEPKADEPPKEEEEHEFEEDNNEDPDYSQGSKSR